MTITVTNQSSRSFILGGEMILPHTPIEITEEVKFVIDNSPYHSFFTYEITEDPPPGRDARQEDDEHRQVSEEEQRAIDESNQISDEDYQRQNRDR